MFHFTASASNTEPSWNFTSFRSVKVTLFASSLYFQLSASHGMISPFGETRTSESYIA